MKPINFNTRLKGSAVLVKVEVVKKIDFLNFLIFRYTYEGRTQSLTILLRNACNFEKTHD